MTLTPEQLARFEAIMQEMRNHDKARGDFFQAGLAYAESLGRGDATREQRLHLERLKAAYEAA